MDMKLATTWRPAPAALALVAAGAAADAEALIAAEAEAEATGVEDVTATGVGATTGALDTTVLVGTAETEAVALEAAALAPRRYILSILRSRNSITSCSYASSPPIEVAVVFVQAELIAVPYKVQSALNSVETILGCFPKYVFKFGLSIESNVRDKAARPAGPAPG